MMQGTGDGMAGADRTTLSSAQTEIANVPRPWALAIFHIRAISSALFERIPSILFPGTGTANGARMDLGTCAMRMARNELAYRLAYGPMRVC